MKSQNAILATLMVVVVLLLGYVVLNTPEHRTVGEKINDAAKDLQDRTPAQKVKDEINDHK